MSLTYILLIGAGIIFLLWLVIRFKIYRLLGEILEGIGDIF